MLSNITDYDYTTAQAPTSGRHFGDSMCPRLEEREWLNELVRTAEVRGSFVPSSCSATYGDRSLGGGIVEMMPTLNVVNNIITRMNNVMTVPYYDVAANAFNPPTTLKYGTQLGWMAAEPTFTTAELTTALEAYKTMPGGVSYTPSMFIDRSFLSTVSNARWTLVSRLERSAIRTGSIITSFINGYNTHWNKDGQAGSTPSDDTYHKPDRWWYYATQHLLSPSYTGTYFKAAWTHPTRGSDSEIFRWNNTYSFEADEWSYSIQDPPWLHDYDRWSPTIVYMLIVWRIIHYAMWGFSESSSMIRDYTTNFRYVLTPYNGAMRRFYAERDHSSGTTSFNFGNYSTIKEIGDAICTTYNVANLPRVGPNTEMDLGEALYSGYEVQVDPVMMVTCGSAKPRDINW